MPGDDKIKKYYAALNDAYGASGTVSKGSFTLGYDDFATKISNQEYAQKIYGALHDAYGENGKAAQGAFSLSFDDFYNKVKPEQKTTSDYFNAGLTPEQIQQKNVPQDEHSLNIGMPVVQKTKGVVPNLTTNKPNIKEAIDNHINDFVEKYQIIDPKDIDRERASVIQEYKKGNLVPAKENGKSVLKEGAGFGKSFTHATQHEAEVSDENTYLFNADRKTAITYLNNTKANPETSIVKESKTAPSGFKGELGNFIGENLMFLTKGTVGAIGGGLSELTGGASFGTFLSTIQDIAHGGYSQALKNNYYLLKEQHPEMSDDEAFDKARNVGLAAEATSIATGAILAHSVPEANPKAVDGLVNNLKESFTHAVKTYPKVAGTAAAGSIATDIAGETQGAHQDFEKVLENAGEATKNITLMHFGLWGLGQVVNSGAHALSDNLKPHVENIVASAPREEVRNFYQAAEQNGVVPEGTTQKVENRLSEFDNNKKVVEDLPIPEDQKAIVASRLTDKKIGEPENISKPIELSVEENNQWNELPLSEKLKLAKENLPEVSNLSDIEIAKIADTRAKELLSKIPSNEKAEVQNIETPAEETDAGATTNNEHIPAEESGIAETIPAETIQPTTEEQPIVNEPEIKTEPPIIEPPIVENIAPESKEENTTSIKNEVTKAEREQRGLGEVEVEARRSFPDTFEKGKELVDNGTIDHRSLANEVSKNPRPLKPEESVALVYGRMKLQNEHKQVTELLKDAYESGDKAAQLELSVRQSKIQGDINTNDIAARKTGYEQGLGLAVRRMMIKEDYSLANQMQQFRNANGGEEIPVEVKKKIEALTSKLDEANKKLDEFEQRIKELEAQKNINKEKKKATSKTKDDFKKERDEIFKNISDKWKGAGKDILSSDVPYRKQLAAIAPDVAKLIKSYAEEGIIKLSEIIDDIHAKLSPSIPEIKKDDIKDLLAGEYNEKKEKKGLDPEKMRLQANVEKIKDQIDIEKYKIQQSKRTNFQKGLDWFAKFRRAIILSSVQTLGKLTSAATYRQATNVIEEVVGAGLSKIPGISNIAKGAPREGGASIKAEAKSISQWWQKATYQDIVQITKTGKGELDYLYGAKRDLPQSALDFIGHVHGALKAPAKRAEFFRSFEKRMEHAAKNGIDISDPLEQTKIATESYIDANRAIFMQDNKLTSAYQRLVGYLEHEGGNVGKTGATALRVLLPIVKIPTNYVAETTSYAAGYLKALPLIGKGIIKGLDSITPQQKDYILRNLKKGSVGAAIFALGYFNPQALGGYYSGKRNQKDLKAGDLKLFGVELPHWMLHAPILEVLQMGATLRRVQDEYALKEKEGGTAAGVGTIAKGLAEEVPFISEQLSTSKAVENKGGATNYIGELTKSFVVPPDVERIAKAMDKDEQGNPNYRKPEGIIQHVESAIPKLRENVPMHPIKMTIDKENTVWDYLTEKGIDLPQLNKNTIRVAKDGKHPEGKITDDKEFSDLFKLREKKIIEYLQEAMANGVGKNENGNYTVIDGDIDKKEAKKLSRDERVQLMKSISEKATDEAKEELFPNE